uniref:Reverse transcriptase domain-containing protein n=1 Tax=Vespula pensylvanica TaxID=30213 RepID=A0A834KTV6_VESPE|nr:hypothetical protein H0235_012613 [Vespula pensylvanica]
MLIENAIDDYQLHKTRKTKVEVTIILKNKESYYAAFPFEITRIAYWWKGKEKKDGGTRLCIDYRQVNKKIVRDIYSFPFIEDHTLDIKNWFFHIPVNKNSRKYTAFIVSNGHYEFCKVPFGLIIAETELHTDVSTDGCDAILLQKCESD